MKPIQKKTGPIGKPVSAKPTTASKTPTAKTPTTSTTTKTSKPTAKTATGSIKTPAATTRTTTSNMSMSPSRNTKTAPAGKTLSVQKTAVQRGMATANGLRDLFEVGLKDIYYAEKVLAKSLPKMVKNATSPELVNELNNHLAITKEQVSRLEQIFKSTGIKAQAVKCDAMDGILKETDNMMQIAVKGTVRDAGIISSDQKVDHYEIASFGTLHAYAKTLGEHEAANLLSLTLDEAKKIDAALTRLAVTSINNRAWQADAITTIKK
jgi:ferritin-like metal-binding protein YciE